MAIEWGRQAWSDHLQSTITNCFQKTGLYPRDEPIEYDPFEGEELAKLKTGTLPSLKGTKTLPYV